MLSHTLSIWEYVIDAMEQKHFPTVEEATEFLRATGGRGIVSNYRVSQAASKRRSVKTTPVSDTDSSNDYIANITNQHVGSNLAFDLDLLDEDNDDFDEDRYKSIYDLNNTTVDLPIHGDLNSSAVVKGIVNYYTDIKDKCLKETIGCTDDDPVHEDDASPEVIFMGNPWAEAGWDRADWPIPWMKANGPSLSGDGQPSFGLLKLRDQENMNKVYTVIAGGFHMLLEIHKMRGRMFAGSHMAEIWKAWRPTEKQQNWAFSPGDPNQVDEELFMYYFALVSSVVTACLEEKQTAGDTSGVSAVEAYEFMLNAFKENPFYTQLVSEMRTAEVVFLLHCAEEEADAKAYVCGLKFAAPLFTANHATKYTFILAKFFQWWHCASEADKKIYKTMLMTKKTERGKNIFTDRFVEWLVKDLRGGGIRKFYRRGTDKNSSRETPC
eukprot:scaffold67372_cov26-Cyclotella_meneghiniana.AAC.1